MVYLMIIIVAAVAGITRLALQHRREQRFHLLDDFRSGLERLSTQPLPSQPRPVIDVAPRRRFARMTSRRPASPRGEWDRIAPQPTPAFAAQGASMEATADAFFGPGHNGRPETQGHVMEQSIAPEVEAVEKPSPRVRSRSRREPILAGRLWRKPREPWFWTYEKKATPGLRASRIEDEVEYVDFSAQEVHYVEGNLARSAHAYGQRSHQTSPSFTGPRGPARRSGLDPAKREAAKRRLEVRRRAGSRLN